MFHGCNHQIGIECVDHYATEVIIMPGHKWRYLYFESLRPQSQVSQLNLFSTSWVIQNFMVTNISLHKLWVIEMFYPAVVHLIKFACDEATQIIYAPNWCSYKKVFFIGLSSLVSESQTLFSLFTYLLASLFPLPSYPYPFPNPHPSLYPSPLSNCPLTSSQPHTRYLF